MSEGAARPGSAAWHEEDEFWRAVAASLFDDQAWKTAAAEAVQLRDLLDLPRRAAVLDLGCGPGRFLVPLAELGFAVTGVDRTGSYVETARARAGEAGLQVEVVHADMREFKRPTAFDAAISMLTSFGYFEDPEQDLRVLQNVCESLRPGGALLIDTVGKEVLGRIFQPRDWKRAGNEFWLFDRRPVGGWSWMQNTWIRIHDGRVSEYELGHRLFSAVELASIARAAGFADTQVFGGLEGTPYDESAKRLVLVARKPT